jgi:tRNA nucleotidyltransferase (CCA-adding enzyme)
MDIQLKMSTLALMVLRTLRQAGFEAYLVGGAVRDLLKNDPDLDTTKIDYDFTTNAQPEEILALFSNSFYENTFGTVSITAEHLLEQVGVPTDQWSRFALPMVPPTDANRIIDLATATKIHESLTPTSTNQDQAMTTDTEGREQQTPHPAPKLGLPLFEITTFRSDGAYSDNRRPDSVTWGTSLTEDLERRDFTFNAMAISVADRWLNQDINTLLKPGAYTTLSTQDITIHDPHQGLTDLSNHTLQTVGDPHRRFAEDALRMLRAVRFSVQLNVQISDLTFNAIKEQAASLHNISQERISDELLKILSSKFPAEGIELLDQTGLLEYILPELLTCKGVEQGGHHTTDVWTHSIDALRECPSVDPIVRLATLLHDIGKPSTQGFTPNTITFYTHEIVGSRIASSIARRLRLSKKNRERIFTLVRYHMFHYRPEDTDAAIRRFMRKVGLENVDDMLDLREADRLGSGARRTSWRLEEMKQRMIEQLHQPMEVKDLAINGHDVMTEFNLKPGPQLGQILQALFEQVLEQPELNTREELLKMAASLIKTR